MGQQHRFSREYYPALGPSSWDTRGAPIDDNQCTEQQHVSGRTGAPPLQEPIQQVLRNHAHLPVKCFYMFCILEDGKDVSFCTPGTLSQASVTSLSEQIKPMFPPNGMSVSTPSYEDQIPYRRPAFDMKPALDLETSDSFSVGSQIPRKRRGHFDDVVQPRTVTKYTKPIMVKDAPQLWLFYEQRFKNCQQAACKLIAKIWIKTVEPKKQSNHPYTGEEGKAPDWWPKAHPNASPDEKVRHKEPDHLYKRERLRLLGHILRMIMEPPNRQHPDIKKLGLSVAKLEEVTMEALKGWFQDSNSPTNGAKKPYLEEIFKIAKQEERFRDGQIGMYMNDHRLAYACIDPDVDGTTRVHVSTDDRLMDGDMSNTEETSPSRVGDQDRKSTSRSLTPHGGITADLTTYGSTQGPLDEADESANGAYMNDVMIRGHPYAPTLESSDFQEEVARYGEVPPISHGPPMQGFASMSYMSGPDPTRRPVAETQSEFPAASTAGSFDHWGNTSSANSSAVYAMTGHPYQPNPSTAVGHSTGTMTASHSYPMFYDGIPRSHDLGHPPFNRMGGPIPSPTGYPDYGQPGLRSLQDSSVKQEAYTRNIN
ncbi:hypothetical protein G7054_g14758 [Neopestalotiopsis clavispora]|nr:hypothetical protein G7054_g14758 [Neopestalotiopsis clavispora]